MSKPDLNSAAQFLAGSGRVLEKRRFDRLRGAGDAGPVTDAVAAYRNPDGGFGHGLEPDCRCPASQPAAVEQAFRILHEADAWDERLVGGACDWLQQNAATGGGATFVEASVQGWPHAPWWVPEDGRPASLIATGLIAGTLHARGVEHPWLDQATDVMWSRLDELSAPTAYEMLGVCRFLDYVPDRERAQRAFDLAGPLLLDGELVALDPHEAGEVHGPLEFAPLPQSLARQVFDDKTITAHLDHLAGSQREDGGWTFNWFEWSPAAAADWRGVMTVQALSVLRQNRRL
ncbi:MAG: hypothetical protein ACLQFR_21500 [Streptosporangiaceae bacterium]